MSITVIHPDIINTHILTKLDGNTLACAATTSTFLSALCTEEKLWRDICTAKWPSINDPRVCHVISKFPSGYRSFFSDSSTTTTFPHATSPRHPSSELISTVDIRYKNNIIYSKVEESDNLLSVDILHSKEMALLPVNFKSDNVDEFLTDLEESISLSWILIDPTRNRSLNLCTHGPIYMQRNYDPDEVQLLYVTVLPGYSRVGSSEPEPVQCRIVITCGGEMHVTGVNIQVQDMDGINLSCEDSLVILQGAMESERIKQGKGKEIYMFLEMKRVRKEKIERRDNILDVVCIVIRNLSGNNLVGEIPQTLYNMSSSLIRKFQGWLEFGIFNSNFLP